MKKPAPACPRRARTKAEDRIDLRLYVAGTTLKSVAALRNLRQLCEEHLAGQYRIEVIDLTKSPQLAGEDQVLAVPTLVRQRPSPRRRVIGTLANGEQVLDSLGICHAESA